MSSNPIGDPGHGHSPAAWTAVIIMLAALALATVAFFLEVPWLVWTGVVLIVVGLIVGWAMARAGYGVNGPKYSPKEH
jgi:carbon starvation protein CstA